MELSGVSSVQHFFLSSSSKLMAAQLVFVEHDNFNQKNSKNIRILLSFLRLSL